MLSYLGILVAMLQTRWEYARDPERSDRGASALEWAIIAAIAVVIASVIGAVVYNVVKGKSNDLQNCANQPVGSACSQ